jgi:polar amino acid transport system permease protein
VQTFRFVVMPQAIRAIVPALINRFVNLFMYTSIVALIGIFDLMYAAIAVNNRDLIYPLQIFGFVGVVYFVFCYGITRIGRILERRWDWAPRIKTFTAAV